MIWDVCVLTERAVHFDRRLVIVFALGGLLFLVTWLSTLRERGDGQLGEGRPARRLAPAFRLYDQNSELVNLTAYLNRHKIVLVFFDGQKSPLQNAAMNALLKNRQLLETADYRVFGISTALPQQNRAVVAEDFPFALLSDPAAIQPDSAHRAWGCLRPPDAKNPKASTIPNVFVIDRLGRVNWEGKLPSPIDPTDNFVQRLLDGDFD